MTAFFVLRNDAGEEPCRDFSLCLVFFLVSVFQAQDRPPHLANMQPD